MPHRGRALRLLLAIVPVAALLLIASLGLAGSSAQPARVAHAQGRPSERFFPETGFQIGDDPFWQYFQARGAVATFGYPTSRPFLLLGTRVQFFQRHVMQLTPDGRVGLLNLLDDGLLPYTNFGNATVPAFEPLLASAAPSPDTPDYGQAVAAFLATTVPNEWRGLPVGFLDAFLAPARAGGETDPNVQVLIGLELLGFPTSRPAADPANAAFIYQRFQRGVLHFDAGTGLTQPLLLADYLKGLIRGRDVPPALLAQAASSRFAAQYAPGFPQWLARPFDLPGTDLTAAFEREDVPLVVPPSPTPVPPAPTFPVPPTLVPIPTVTPFPTAPPTLTPTPLPPEGAATATPTTNPQPPVLEGAEPGGAAIGQDIVLRGRNFGTQPGHVFFTGKLTTAQVWSDTNIIVTVPQGAVDGVIRVRRADGVFSNAIGFAPQVTPTPAPTDTPTVVPTPSLTPTPSVTPTPAPPTISSMNPYYGAPNSSFFITGSNFGAVTGQVLMGSSFAPVEANGWSDTSIAGRVPSDLGTGTARVFVRRPDGFLNASPACFTVVLPSSTATPTPGPTPTVVGAC